MLGYNIYGTEQVVGANDHSKLTELAERLIGALHLPSRMSPSHPRFHRVNVHR